MYKPRLSANGEIIEHLNIDIYSEHEAKLYSAKNLESVYSVLLLLMHISLIYNTGEINSNIFPDLS